MSYQVNSKNEITLTRGDTFRVKVSITKDGEEYVPEEGDIIRFALKSPRLNAEGTEYAETDPLILKVIPNDTMLLELEPEDSKPLGFGNYVYDVEITFSDGTVDTFITKKKFKLTEEVH